MLNPKDKAELLARKFESICVVAPAYNNVQDKTHDITDPFMPDFLYEIASETKIHKTTLRQRNYRARWFSNTFLQRERKTTGDCIRFANSVSE